jgi:hypothetical protein
MTVNVRAEGAEVDVALVPAGEGVAAALRQ